MHYTDGSYSDILLLTGGLVWTPAHREQKPFLCPPTNFYVGTTCLKCLCGPSVGPHCLSVPSEQRQTWHFFSHPPVHRLLSSGRNWRYWTCTGTAGFSSQFHIRPPQLVTTQCHMATKDASFEASVFLPQKAHIKEGGPTWEVGWDKQTYAHAHRHTHKPQRCTHWDHIICREKQHTNGYALALQTTPLWGLQLCSSEWCRWRISKGLYGYVMMKCTLVQQ